MVTSWFHFFPYLAKNIWTLISVTTPSNNLSPCPTPPSIAVTRCGDKLYNGPHDPPPPGVRTLNNQSRAGRTCDLVLINRIWQRWQEVCPVVTPCCVRLCLTSTLTCSPVGLEEAICYAVDCLWRHSRGHLEELWTASGQQPLRNSANLLSKLGSEFLLNPASR